MIEMFSPSRRKSAFTHTRHQAYEYKAPIIPSMFKEAARRDALIKDLVSKLQYKEHEVCLPYTKEHQEEYGECRVTKICDSYAKFGKSEWPENDMPMITHAFSIKQNSHFICTPHFLVPKGKEKTT